MRGLQRAECTCICVMGCGGTSPRLSDIQIYKRACHEQKLLTFGIFHSDTDSVFGFFFFCSVLARRGRKQNTVWFRLYFPNASVLHVILISSTWKFQVICIFLLCSRWCSIWLHLKWESVEPKSLDGWKTILFSSIRKEKKKKTIFFSFAENFKMHT